MFDVIVVGAGIGGAAVAYFLGRVDQQVLVLEKEALPRYKACGGGVPKPVFRRFPFLFDESETPQLWSGSCRRGIRCG